ncbi:diacylglycerol/lipid kinase family protein [Rosistilla oblonga]|uniref:Diacylglycerol kinase n=1 Tax=Rosistilla oblonga TaxID=2527990 RepID=A0A518IRC7_9BACT|nr:diacylglycerol kinase family protein [Rosistilla oblonga]QDV55651.1 Diacylglycerol kinase [Rosistilla oblonga]
MNESPEVVLICTSPKAGSGQRRDLVPKLAHALTDRGLEVRSTSNIDQLAADAKSLTAAGRLKGVVAAGGDGTLSLVVSRLPAESPVMPLPLGTENLMARYLGHRPSAEDAADTIMRQRTVVMDAALAGERLFLIMCSCGFDAEVVRRLHTTRSGHIWKLSYLAPVLRSMIGYHFPSLRLIDRQSDEQPVPARWAFVFNVPRYAVGLPIAAWADGTDGWLDSVTFDKGSVYRALHYLAHIFRRSHHTLDGTIIGRSRRFTIEPTDPAAKIPYQLDGDFVGYLPVEIAVQPSRVTMLLPQHCPVEFKTDTGGHHSTNAQPSREPAGQPLT